MDAQTAGPIVSKFGMGIQEHLEIAIGYVLCTWVQGGRREGRRKRDLYRREAFSTACGSVFSRGASLAAHSSRGEFFVCYEEGWRSSVIHATAIQVPHNVACTKLYVQKHLK